MDDLREKITKFIYYLLIAIISIVSMAILPMLDSKVEGGFQWPKNGAEWFVWGMMRASTAVINILIFYCFMQQAKLNVKDNEKYKEANDILHRLKKKVKKPRSPGSWNGRQYGGKGTTIFVFSILSTIAITSAILTYNTIVFLAFVFTVTLGLVFGILQMKSAEVYWTTEYHEYAMMVKALQDEEEKKASMALDQKKSTDKRVNCIPLDSRSHLLESGGTPIFDRALEDGGRLHSVLGSSLDASNTAPDCSSNLLKKIV